MHIHLICIGKLKERYWQEAVAEYSKRLRKFCTLTISELKEERIPDKASPAEERAAVEREGQSILQAIRPGSYVVALAIEGKAFTSPQLAQKLDELALHGKSELAFIIGGSLGLSPAVLAAADLQLSFSKMTFPHQMMRVIFLEQIYRGFKINHNETYHK